MNIYFFLILLIKSQSAKQFGQRQLLLYVNWLGSVGFHVNIAAETKNRVCATRWCQKLSLKTCLSPLGYHELVLFKVFLKF